MEIEFISLEKGINLCYKSGVKITSASLEKNECLEYIPEDGFYLCGKFIGKTIYSAKAYFEKELWASHSKWYVL